MFWLVLFSLDGATMVGATRSSPTFAVDPRTGLEESPEDCDDTPPPPPVAESPDADCGEVPLTWWYRDNDGDGYGTIDWEKMPDGRIAAEKAPKGYTDKPGDCDDTDARTYPGAPEPRGPIDRNCDGKKGGLLRSGRP